MPDISAAGSRARSLAARLGVVVAVLAVLDALRPGVVENGLRSPRVWATVLLTLVASRLVALVVRRTTGRTRAAALAGNLVLVVIGAVLLAPSFQQRTVEEPFPQVAQTAATGTPAPAPASAPPASEAPATAEPRRVGSGQLEGIGHSGSGQVVLYAVGDRLVLRFDDVDIEGTPGPYVHLVREGGRTPDGGLELGELTAERGTFSYTLPSGVDASVPWTVLVWCRPYATPVAAADLAPV